MIKKILIVLLAVMMFFSLSVFAQESTTKTKTLQQHYDDESNDNKFISNAIADGYTRTEAKNFLDGLKEDKETIAPGRTSVVSGNSGFQNQLVNPLNTMGQAGTSLANFALTPVSVASTLLTFLSPTSWWQGGLAGMIGGTTIEYLEQCGSAKKPCPPYPLDSKETYRLINPQAVPGMLTELEELGVIATNLPGFQLFLTKTESGSNLMVEDTVDIIANPRGLKTYANKDGLMEAVYDVGFQNISGITQEDELHPFYRILQINATQFDYELTYPVDGGKRSLKRLLRDYADRGNHLAVKPTSQYDEQYHLQFNSFKSTPIKPQPFDVKSCLLDGKTGETGVKALPNVSLDWDWGNVEIDTCDTEKNGIYCDATQFSISLLKRVNEINDELSGITSLNCPVAGGVSDTAAQKLSDVNRDIAVTEVSISSVSGSEVEVSAVLESNNSTALDVSTILQLETPVGTKPCLTPPSNVSLSNPTTVSCIFDISTFGTGDYNADVNVNLVNDSKCNPIITPTCEDNDTENNQLKVPFVVGSTSGLVQCTPYNTNRLSDYVNVQGNPKSKLQKVIELTHFTANLTSDGYSTDFRKDFDFFMKSQSFFSVDKWYTESADGLHKYFSDEDSMKINNSFLDGFGSLPAGIYDVTISIEYNDDSWDLFDGINKNAVINVDLVKVREPYPDSVFYDMPFDGLIGTVQGSHETSASRQGYGLEYILKTLTPVQVNDQGISYSVKTTPQGSSNPTASLSVTELDEFKILNTDRRRGVVMELDKGKGNSIEMTYSPTRAAPVVLQVEGGASESAWAFYSLSVAGQTQFPPKYLTKWDGLTAGCKDFSGQAMQDTFNNTADVQGGISKASGGPRCAIGRQDGEYGVEWCNIREEGPVFLGTVMYVPAGANQANLKMISSVDSSFFIGPDGTSVSTAVDLVSSSHTVSIESIQDIFNHVKTEEVCIAGLGSGSNEKYFWNPAKIFENNDGIQTFIKGIPAQCIQEK